MWLTEWRRDSRSCRSNVVPIHLIDPAKSMRPATGDRGAVGSDEVDFGVVLPIPPVAHDSVVSLALRCRVPVVGSVANEDRHVVGRAAMTFRAVQAPNFASRSRTR